MTSVRYDISYIINAIGHSQVTCSTMKIACFQLTRSASLIQNRASFHMMQIALGIAPWHKLANFA